MDLWEGGVEAGNLPGTGGGGVMSQASTLDVAASVAAGIAGLLALKYLTESDLIPGVPGPVRVSVSNWLGVGLMSATFLIALKVGSRALAERGFPVGGLQAVSEAV